MNIEDLKKLHFYVTQLQVLSRYYVKGSADIKDIEKLIKDINSLFYKFYEFFEYLEN